MDGLIIEGNRLFHAFRQLPINFVIWEVWKERNRRIFHDKKMNIERLYVRIDHLIEEIVSVVASLYIKIDVPFSTKDSLTLQKRSMIKF